MEILILTIQKKWLEKIISGEKKKEYREVKPFYNSRLLNTISRTASCWNCTYMIRELTEFCELGKRLKDPEKHKEHLYHICKDYSPPYKHYDAVLLRAGYSASSPQALVELKRICIDYGDTQYDLEPDRLYYVLELGDVINTKNILQRY